MLRAVFSMICLIFKLFISILEFTFKCKKLLHQSNARHASHVTKNYSDAHDASRYTIVGLIARKKIGPPIKSHVPKYPPLNLPKKRTMMASTNSNNSHTSALAIFQLFSKESPRKMVKPMPSNRHKRPNLLE